MTPEEFKIELLPLKNKLFRLARCLTGQREEAEDVVQEVYLKVWDSTGWGNIKVWRGCWLL